ncbi:hypothetical protein [Desulfovibrio sp.]|uniref:hypothetical protein n=1 Tax=Desulfovibrio sp. TaxID=885 RepID=UPI0035B3260F
MTGTELLIVVGLLLVALCVTLVVVKGRVQSIRHEAKRAGMIRSMLETAQGQNEIFDLNVEERHSHKGLAGTLTKILPATLELEILSYASRELEGTKAEVYFRAMLPEGPAFFKFQSTIQQVKGSYEKSYILLSMPKEIDAGQKRHFIRVKPPKDLVRVIGVWEMDPAKPIPRNTCEIGRPLLHYKAGMENELVQVADISATGMALRFPAESVEDKPVDLDKGSQLLCLIIYQVNKEDRVVTFWCTCDVLNIRMQKEPVPALVLGTEFSNWAVLEQGKCDINWFHSTPKSGVSPITQWVMQMDIQQRKLTG